MRVSTIIAAEREIERLDDIMEQIDDVREHEVFSQLLDYARSSSAN